MQRAVVIGVATSRSAVHTHVLSHGLDARGLVMAWRVPVFSTKLSIVDH